jgi:hypothetical protein
MPVLGAEAPAGEAGRSQANDIYAFTGHANQDVTLTVDGLNRFLSGGGVSYDYDDRGNMTADGVRAYAYDFDNRLTSVTGGGTGDVSLSGACPRACP